MFRQWQLQSGKYFSNINYQTAEDTSYLARDVLKDIFKGADKNEADYFLKLNVAESESAVNVESDGSVVEYRVEALIQYELYNSEKLIYKSQSRGPPLNIWIQNTVFLFSLCTFFAVDPF